MRKLRRRAQSAFAILVALWMSASSDGVAQLTTQRLAIPFLESVVINPTSVTGGALVSGTVWLSAPAGSTGVTVKLLNSNPAIASVPASVMVYGGMRSATFVVQTIPVATNPNVVTDAPSTDISGQIGSAALKVVRLTVLPARLTALVLSASSIPGGNNVGGQVSISGPAPVGGLTLALSALEPETSTPVELRTVRTLVAPLVTVPSQVTVPAGSTSAPFTGTTRSVATPTNVSITAAQGVFITRNATLTLLPPAVSSITFSPNGAAGGTTLQGAVSLTSSAPAGGMAVGMHLSPTYNSGIGPCGPAPTVPSAVTVPAGAPSVSFSVETYLGRGTWAVHANGVHTPWWPLRVKPPLLAADALVLPQSVKGGTPIQAKLQLQGKATPVECGNQYPLASSNTLFAQVPAFVAVTTGESQASFTITTSAVASNQTVVITVFGYIAAPANNGEGSREYTLTLTPN